MTPEDLADPIWRLHNLYTCKRAEDGRVVPFVPRPEQSEVYDRLLRQGQRRLIILKARRLGMSTAIDIMLADQTAWNSGMQCSIVDQTAADAERKLSTIVKVALDGLPEDFKGRIKYTKDSGSILEMAVADDTSSGLFAGLRARGGTNNFLHLSEWGVIQADDPRRSEEILTGAIPSAEHGTIVVETTWKGGKGGHLWKLVKEAMETPDEAKTEKDWRLLFFPWWTDPTYSIEGDPKTISPENLRYLRELQPHLPVQLTPGQAIWYDRQQKQLGIFMFREFPSTIEECFRAPIEGAIYADAIGKLRAQGAIQPMAVDGTALVHTFWDLGSPTNTVTWYVQLIGNEIRVIDCDMDLDMTITERVAHILAKGYNLGFHYLPHDAGSTPTSGRSVNQELQDSGLKNTRLIPRTIDIWIGINRLRQLLPRFTFRLPACEEGVNALENYHTKRESSGGIAQDLPVHDWSSHASDALRMLAEAEAASLLEGGSQVARMAKRRRRPQVLTGLSDDQSDRPRSRIDAILGLE